MNAAISWIWVLPCLLAGVVGVAALVGWRRTEKRRSAALWLGSATWVAAVAAKVAWAVPTNAAVHRALVQAAGERIGQPLFWLYIGVLTGVFEVGATLAMVRFTRLRRAQADEAVAFGVGFGSIEAILLGIAGIAPVLLMLLAPRLLPQAARDALLDRYREAPGITTLLVPALERFSTLLVHVVSCALVFHGFRVRRVWRWFVVAFVYKSVVDAAAAWGILSYGVKSSDAHLGSFELGLLAFAVASAAALHYFLRYEKRSEVSSASSVA